MIKKLNILLVEDDDVAAESVVRSLKKVSPEIPVTVAANGQEALDLIEDNSRKKTIGVPFLILLDLNMPVMNGFEFLNVIRNSEKYRDLVVFILTTSNSDYDVTRAYSKNVAGYMVKSAVGPQFAKLARLLSSYREAIEPKDQ